MEVALQVAGRVFVDTTPIDKVLLGRGIDGPQVAGRGAPFIARASSAWSRTSVFVPLCESQGSVRSNVESNRAGV